MGWEARGRRLHFYRKLRGADGRVKSVHFGADSVGEAAAALDELRRSQRADARRAVQAALKSLIESEAVVCATAELSSMLAEAAMLAAGYHRHRHQWRRRRHGARPAD